MMPLFLRVGLWNKTWDDWQFHAAKSVDRIIPWEPLDSVMWNTSISRSGSPGAHRDQGTRSPHTHTHTVTTYARTEKAEQLVLKSWYYHWSIIYSSINVIKKQSHWPSKSSIWPSKMQRLSFYLSLLLILCLHPAPSTLPKSLRP